MKTKPFDPDDVELDAEEQALLESFERNEWKSINNLAEKMVEAKQIAANTLRKSN